MAGSVEISSGAHRVRVGLFPSFFYTREKSGEMFGFGVAFAQAFAESMSARLELVQFASPPDAVRALKAGECDVAFLGVNPDLGIDFTPAYLRADFTFVAPRGIDDIAQIDSPGRRVAVVRDHAMERALAGKLQHAELVRVATPDEAFAYLLDGRADVSAGIRPGLIAFARGNEGFHVLKDRYGENVLALGVARDQPEWLSRATGFIRDARGGGFLQRLIDESKLEGVDAILT
jgi:polar amino acid transport system substrate-binding protein